MERLSLKFDIYADKDIIVNGNVNGSIKAKGNVACKKVGGSVKAGNNVTCYNINGSVKVGGNVSGNASGSIMAGNDINGVR